MMRAFGNWRTTIAGLLTLVFQGIKQAKPALSPILDALTALATAAIGYFAKDAATGSEPGARI